jgi:hypothetical protein
MRIRDLFQKEITRDIKGVIKVEQQQEQNIYQELDEYVVTKELHKHFNHFYTAYNKSLTNEIDEMGVWISGFFGSGKSHFLKILSYLIENKEVNGKKAVEFFAEKIGDPMLLGEMRRAVQPTTDVILFNIDSKSDADSKVKKDAIVKVFMRVFNERLGFCDTIPWIAEMERQLIKRGNYQAFQEAFAEIAEDSWLNLRGNAYFDRDYIIAALTKTAGMSKESAIQWFDNAESNYSINIESFAKLVRDYCNETKHRVVFMVDEMGQYIGESSDLMLNLQTVAEDLGTHLRGKAWVVVTSQEDIDGITNNRVKGKDFSKIIGRFATRISLSSSNTDEVIKRRVLEKNNVAKDTLKLIYAEKDAILRNLICFSSGTAEMKSYRDDHDFIETYPFIPYQFNLVQKVFEAIRKFGMTGKHLAEGERSMLSAFQGAAVSVKDEILSILIPFDAFYQTVEMFVDTNIKRVFAKATENSRLEEFDSRVLQTLFMIKHVKELSANLENLTTLMLTDLDEDKINLRKQIMAALNRLQSETLIQQNGDEYYFLTDDEQEINREIKDVNIDERDIVDYAGKYIFDNIYGSTRFTYSKLFNYTFNRKVDSIMLSQPGNDLTVQILTPYAVEFNETPEILKLQSFDSGTLVVRLPEENHSLHEIREVLRLEKYLRRKNSVNNPENIQKILDDKGREITTRKSRIATLLEEEVAGAELFATGGKLDIRSGSAKELINKGLELLVGDFYRKLDYIKKPIIEPQEIAAILKVDEVQLPLLTNGDNRQAIAEVLSHVRTQDEQNLRVTMKFLGDRFFGKSYGWRPYDLAGVVATLWVTGEIKLQYSGEFLEFRDKNVVNYLTKPSEAEKLIVFLRKKTDVATLNIVRQIGREVFNKPYLANDEDGMFEELRTAVQEEIENLNGFMGRYQNRDYPGKDSVVKGLKLLKEIIAFKNATSFFQELKTQKESLLAWIEEIAPVKGFFQNQVIKYDEARIRLDYYQHNLNYVTLYEVGTELGNLTQVMESPAPYGQIKDIPYMLKNLDDIFNTQLAQRKKEVRDFIQGEFQRLEAEIVRLGLAGEFAENLQQVFTKLFTILDQATDFAQTDALKSRCGEVTSKLWTKIDDFHQTELKKDSEPVIEGKTEPPLPPPVKKTIQVRVNELSKSHSLLENEADVNRYVEELRKKLLEMIKEDQQIRLL